MTQILSRVKFYDARTTWEEHWIGLSNFGRKKAGAGKLGYEWSWNYILLELRPKFAFFKNICYNKRLGVELGAE